MLPAWTSKYFYIGLFIGMVSIGELTLIPGVYLGYISNIPLVSILGVALVGSIASDTFWYIIGYYFPKKKLMRFSILRREMDRAKALQPLYEKHKLRTVFFSKFMYGTTVFFQLLAGANHISYISYILISTSATITWFIVATVLGIILGASIGVLKNFIISIEIIATITFLIGIASYFTVCYIAKKKFSYRLSEK